MTLILPDVDLQTKPSKLRKNTPESRAIMQAHCLRSIAVNLEMIAVVITDERKRTDKPSLDFDRIFEALSLVSVRAPIIVDEKQEGEPNETT